MTILIHFIVPYTVNYVLLLISAGLSISLPTVNHVRMFLSVRRHNNQVVGNVNQQQLNVTFKVPLRRKFIGLFPPNSVAEYRVLFIFPQKTEQQTVHPNIF